MDVSLLSSDSQEWAATLEATPHDFYHLAKYAKLCAKLDAGEARALLVRDRENFDGRERTLFLPFIARSIIDTSVWDAVSPYGYPGPLVTGTETDEERDAFASRAIEAAAERLQSEQCVSLFVRLHPLLGARPQPTPKNSLLVQHGETVYVDLRKSESVHWSETMSGHRNEINRALKGGHRAYFDDDFIHGDRFLEIYQATMARVGASAYYFFDRDYLAALRDALGTRLKLAVVEIDGVVAAAGLFVVTGEMIQYHLSGTDAAYARKQPNKLMLHFVRAWGRDQHLRWLHLGGGVGGAADSLFKFKAGFSEERCAFFTLRMVVNPSMYKQLVLSKHPTAADHENLDGFFPLYRRGS